MANLLSTNVTGTISATNLSGTNTGDQTNISGNAATATTASSVTGLTLNSSASPINPDNVTQNQIGYNTSVSLYGQTDGGLYSSAHNSAWIHQIYGDFRTGQIAIRGKLNGTWQAWRNVLDSSNYTSYAPSLTGSGASGTWAISITGSAGSVGGYGVSAGVGANTVVIRDANGYAFFNYINSNVSETENPTINSFYTSNGDGYFRKSSVAHVKSQLGLGSAAYVATSTFAAASHNHTIDEVSGLADELAGKQVAGSYAAASHTHTIANVTGLQTALDGKQASLGFTPYNATNPAGYITSSGSI
jgi:hypothetical protein